MLFGVSGVAVGPTVAWPYLKSPAGEVSLTSNMAMFLSCLAVLLSGCNPRKPLALHTTDDVNLVGFIHINRRCLFTFAKNVSIGSGRLRISNTDYAGIGAVGPNR